MLAIIITGVTLAITRPWEGGTENAESCENADSTEGDEDGNVEYREDISDIAGRADELSFDDAISYLDDKISEYEGTDYEFGVRMVKIYYLLNNGNIEAAFDEAGMVNTEQIASEDLLDYYSVMTRIEESLGNETSMMQYQDMYAVLYNYLYDEDEWSDDEGAIDDNENGEHMEMEFEEGDEEGYVE